MNRAIIRYHKKQATVLCPNGHVVTSIDLGKTFGGSMAESELGQRQAGRSNLYDRLATKCAETDAKEASARTHIA